MIKSGQNKPSNDARCTDTLRPLGNQELSLSLDRSIDIIAFGRTVWKIVMRHVVDLMLVDKLGCHNPRAAGNHFIYPFAVSNCLRSFRTAQNRHTLPVKSFLVTRNTDDEMYIRECLFGLFKLSHVTGTMSIESNNKRNKRKGPDMNTYPI